MYLCKDSLASDILIFYRSAAEIYELAKPYIVIILGSGHNPQAYIARFFDFLMVCKHTVQLAALVTGY